MPRQHRHRHRPRHLITVEYAAGCRHRATSAAQAAHVLAHLMVAHPFHRDLQLPARRRLPLGSDPSLRPVGSGRHPPVLVGATPCLSQPAVRSRKPGCGNHSSPASRHVAPLISDPTRAAVILVAPAADESEMPARSPPVHRRSGLPLVFTRRAVASSPWQRLRRESTTSCPACQLVKP